jgi:hypothetical protein
LQIYWPQMDNANPKFPATNDDLPFTSIGCD